MALHLNSPVDIDRLLQRSRLFDRPEATTIVLPNTLDEAERRRISRRLSFYLSDCGCVPASMTMIGAIVGLCLYQGAAPWSMSLGQIATGFGIAFGLGLVVKTAALALSLKWLRRDLVNLKRRFELIHLEGNAR